MKIFTVYILIHLFIPTESKAIAWTDWEAETPCGNTISDNWGPKSLIVKDSFILKNLEKWYFYKYYIIGRCTPTDGGFTAKCFIYNEHVSSLDTFNNAIEWTTHLQKRNLIPKIWTRWHSSDWDNFSFQDIALIAGILVFLTILFSITGVKKYLKIQRRRTPLIYSAILLILVFKCLIAFPGSI